MQTRTGARGNTPRPQESRSLASYGDNTHTKKPLQQPLASYGGTSDQQTERGETQPSCNQIRDNPCKCCLNYGNDENNCTKTGAAISIAQYLHNCTPEKKRKILQAYRENRVAAHE